MPDTTFHSVHSQSHYSKDTLCTFSLNDDVLVIPIRNFEDKNFLPFML